jgi:uncharacterized NAD(P)/FAD-binding protein YdhS
MATIAIVGAGFSGTLLTLHLLRRCCAATRIHLIERNRQFGPGAAYSTGNASHLLNVPAAKMSAFRDRPGDFVDWLQDQEMPDLGPGAGPGTFVPRQLFGAYIRSLLLSEMRRPDNVGRLKLSRGTVGSLAAGAGGLTLSLDRGRSIEADLAVLAIGNFPPEPPPGADDGLLGSRLYRADPWGADTFTALDPEAPVMLLGTGLTTIDAIISLIDHGHRGPIHALSRRGLLPRRHEAGATMAAPPSPALPTRLSQLTRSLREATSQALAEGRSWQPVLDQLRPFTQDVWNALSAEDRQRFLRHLRPWWDVHRHRMAPAVADRIAARRASGQLQIHVGRIERFETRADCVLVSYRRRRSGEQVVLEAGRVINCAGPGCDYDRITDPLVRSLLAAGLVRPDSLRLGLDVTANCALKQRDGSISRRLFAIGPVTKAAFWEMTAVPDIRRQCEFLGEFLAAQLGAPVFAAESRESGPGESGDRPDRPRGTRLPAAAAVTAPNRERLALLG